MASVTAEQMRDRLLTVDQFRETLAQTEPLQVALIGEGTNPRFSIEPNWQEAAQEARQRNEPFFVGEIETDGQTLRLTESALFEATSKIGVPKNFVKKTPATLIEPLLAHHYGSGARAKILTANGNILGMTGDNIVPFSNLELLDNVLQGVGEREVLVDYKSSHQLADTRMRLVIPDDRRDVGRDNDPWSTGIEISNSLTGANPTQVSAYAFRWWCTNGSTTQHGSGKWNRRTMRQEPAEVYAWARDAVDDALRGLDVEFEKLSQMANTAIEPGTMNETVEAVFDEYGVPAEARMEILRYLVENEDMTLYGLHAAITQAANNRQLGTATVNRLLNVGGDMAHHSMRRCDSCHRVSIVD